MKFDTPLPIDAALPELLAALAAAPAAVLCAPPGAGKTTRVPLALLEQPWVGGRKILMLEPRRAAARAAARRMAASLGEQAGDRVGWRVRMDSRVGPTTRIEVVTEGVLIRMLQGDPTLDGVAAVLFDEFHERSLDADLGLALALETQAALRDDLKLLVMSATLDAEPIAELLGGAPLVVSAGWAFPVETRWLGPPGPKEWIEDAVAAAIRRALREETGDILAFMPGAKEIRGTLARIAPLAKEDPALIPLALYGDLSAEEQDRALAPAPPGKRKIVVASAVAETSLTIDGVRVVVDCGLSRVPRFDPRTGMGRLETVATSRAGAEQRRGRAGRTQPGVCYRLWHEAAHGARPDFAAPEMLEADLTPLALELAAWGARDPLSLAWLTPPPAGGYGHALEVLTALGAIDANGVITAHGRAMAALPLHPRLSHLVLAGKQAGLGGLAAEIAALLSVRDPLRAGRARSPDIRARLDALRRDHDDESVDRGALAEARKLAGSIRRAARIKPGEGLGSREDCGLLLAYGWPDRIGQRRGGPGLFRLSGGRGAGLPPEEPLSASDFLAVADLDGAGRDARIRLAAPLTQAELELQFAAEIVTRDVVEWDDRADAALCRRRRLLGALILKDDPLAHPPAEALRAALLTGVRRRGVDRLPWRDSAAALRLRMAFLRRLDGDAWPDWSDAALAETLADWLAPRLDGCARLAHLEKIDLAAALLDALTWEQRRDLDRLAPTHWQAPTGSRLPIDYSGDDPALEVRLQEMFGETATPRIANGKVSLVLRLLSPGRRPVQTTRDLAGFWSGSYTQVKAELRGRYPKHVWPDDPASAIPTARAKPRGT